jgi:putative DNA primase/helicase
MTIKQDFINAMSDAGCAPASGFNPIADDKIHRYPLYDDKRGVESGSYCLKIDGDFGCGWFMSFKQGETHKFTSKTPRTYTAEEKAAFKARMKAEALEKERQEKEGWDKAARKAELDIEFMVPVTSHPYLERKGVPVSDALYVEGDKLVIPQYVEGELSGYQTITPEGEKRFLKGARLRGAYHALTSPSDDFSTVYVCEGYATAASVREAVTAPVWCAFNASNMVPVCEWVRSKHPDARIVVCADNDQWSTNSKGEPYNAGTHYGQQAAVRVGGFMVVPQVDSADPDKRTDFNDIHNSDGIEAVREQVSIPDVSAVDQQRQEVVQSVSTPTASDLPPVDAYSDEAPEKEGTEVAGFWMPFKVLGYNEGEYFYYPFGGKQIVTMTASNHTLNGLLRLASLEDWKYALGGEDGIKANEIPSRGFNALRQIAERKGVFVQNERVRGAGAWIDEGRTVLHCGDKIYVDGVETKPEHIDSEYVYMASQRLMEHSKNPLNNAQANKLREICEMPTWENPLSGSLLAGWLVIAPICPTLAWRPHIWITGESGSGKSTVLERVVKAVVGDIAVHSDGTSTEPSLRTEIGYSGRPVIFDEAEPSPTMDKVIDLARVASSGGKVSKYGQKPFKAQFVACFSSINPPVEKYSDKSRISMLVLKRNRRQDAEAHYNRLLDAIDDTLSVEYQRGLLTRTLDNLDVLLANITTFRKAARQVLNAGREADQIAPMIAGLYLLHTTAQVTLEKAIEFVQAQDWSLHTSIKEISDPEKLLQYISTSMIRWGRTGRDIMVGELIQKWAQNGDGEKDDAYAELVRYGIKPSGDKVYFANQNQNMRKLLRDTDWSQGWGRNLRDLEDAVVEGVVHFTPNNKPRAVSVPLSRFTEGVVSDGLEF